MKFTEALFRKYPNDYLKKISYDNEKLIPFRPEVTLALKRKVTQELGGEREEQCLSEMFNLLTCMKENEFEQSFCSKEIKLLHDCDVKSRETTKRIKADRSSAELIPNMKKLSLHQMNKLLAKFPGEAKTCKHDDKKHGI